MKIPRFSYQGWVIVFEMLRADINSKVRVNYRLVDQLKDHLNCSVSHHDFQISVASLLSSLHQLKAENAEHKDSLDRCVQRRDHLLAVNARLIALGSLNIVSSSASTSSTTTAVNGPSPTPGNRNSVQAPSPRNSAATVSPIRVVGERQMTSPR